MKLKSTLLAGAFLSICSVGHSQTIWDDFDNPENVLYGFYDGTDFQQGFSNPAMGGNNPSALCAKYVRNSGVQYDVMIIDPAAGGTIDDVSDYVSGAKTMSINVFSPAPGITIQITLEDPNIAGPSNYPAGRHSEYTVVTTTTNTWETLTFNMVNQPDLSISNTSTNRMVLLFDPGNFTSNVWLWDDLMGPEFSNPCAGTVADEAIIDDFECQRHLTYSFSNGTLDQGAANPMASGNNTSSICGKFTKYIPPTNDGAFGGALTYPFNTSVYNTIDIDLYSPAAPQDFLLIFQDGAGVDVMDTTFTTSSTSDWQTFTMTLPGVPSSVSIESLVLLLDPTTATEDSIYLDNIAMSFQSLVGINETDLSESLSIFPVPFENNFTVSSEVAIQEITITDLTGKLITNLRNLNEININIDASNYAEGAYIITVLDVNGSSTSRKMIK